MISVLFFTSLVWLVGANVCPNSTLEQRSTKEYSYSLSGATNLMFDDIFSNGVNSYFMGSFQPSSGSPSTQTVVMRTDEGLEPMNTQTYAITPVATSFAGENDLSSFYFSELSTSNFYEISGSDLSVMRSYAVTGLTFDNK